ncbi:hypothetical protein HMPREF3229_00013 [Peptoniphilus harei]|uniref:SLH domain-containing protein n=2 Tax=Peptoniphilus harei TaxID=54005 RepID=A0A133PSS7_9FIRM|nr:hypothetical protein HMPREF3229_00013 [Peptoniphilus harei]
MKYLDRRKLMKNKKILGLLLAGVMVTSIPFNVFADDNSENLDLSEANVPVAVAGEAKDKGNPEEKVTVNFVAVLVEEGKENSTEALGSEVPIIKGTQIAEGQLPPTEKVGYEFGGWYSNKELTTKFDTTKKLENATTIYVKFTKKAPETEKVKVTFDSDGGSKVNPIEVEKGKTVNEPSPAPKKDGFKFVEWQKDGKKFDFSKAINEEVELKAKWEEEKPVVPVKQSLSISGIEYNGRYVSGKVTADGVAVQGATVTLKIDGSKTSKAKETDINGNFTIDLGDYYNYYWNDYYYRNGDRYYNGYEVRRDSDGDYYYIKDGKRNYIWYSDYYRRYRDYKADLVAEKEGFYSTETNLWKDGYYYNNGRYYGRDWWYNRYDARVYPTDISRTNYSASGYLKGYKNRTVYVYDDGTYLGSSKIDSDGYFNVTWNSPYVSTSRSLEYYVNGTSTSDSTYSMIPVVNALSAGASFVRGNAGPYADVTVYDANGVRLGGTTAGSTGIYNISLNRALVAGETIKVEAKESGKISRSTEVKIAGQEAKVTAEVNSPSYIAGYPDGTFKPGKEVTRAEAVRMFVSLVNNGKELPKNPTTKFKDANNKWYSDEINFAVSKGFISGYSDGTFKPNQGITRAEFAQMIAVFVKDGYPGSSNFKDVKGHWASNAIDQLYGNKTIKGFPDGTFKPDQKLTRAEAVTVLNSVFGRNTKATSFANVNTSSLRKFSDVPMSHWAYYEIIDASNGHNAVKGDKAEDVSVWQ